MQTRTRLLCALLALAGSCGQAAQAKIIDCRAPDASAPFVVNLNELEYDEELFPSRKAMLSKFFNRLYDQLDQRRDAEMAGIATVPFRVARCEGRTPTFDGSEFTQPLVKRLLDERVVIEVWGQLGSRRVGGRTEPTAQMNYLIVPVRRANDLGTARAPSLHRFNYPDGEIHAADHVGLISNLDLHAFIAAAIGARAFDRDEFARAHEFLCKSSARLSVIKARLARTPSTKAQSDVIENLRVYAVELAGNARKQIGAAVDKPAAASVRLQDPDNPCADLGGQP